MADSYSITARRSGAVEATVDNGNDRITVGGSSFQPAELFLGGLASCMLAMMVDYAKRNQIEADQVTVEITGEMESRPRRIARIHATVELPTGLPQTHVDALLRAGHKCTVHTTLEQPPEVTVTAAD